MILLLNTISRTPLYEVLGIKDDVLKLRHLVTGEVVERSKADAKQNGYRPIDESQWAETPEAEHIYEQDKLEKYRIRFRR